ncbi:MAG: lipocalin-like domain-containing protein [Gemmatimonadetes bacterium]|nr:lipocalin-like domain-containing protein [Gemmatimonadota bacterium]
MSMASPDSSGRQRPAWDEQPSGRIMYTADGHMAAQLYDTRRAKVRLERSPGVRRGGAGHAGGPLRLLRAIHHRHGHATGFAPG